MDSSTGLRFVDPKELCLSILPIKTRKAFLSCIKFDLFKKNEWYLAGGTALALQEGHRQSVDLDFFSIKVEINEISTERELLKTGKWETSFLDKGTIYGIFENAKMSFISYPFFIPSENKLQCYNVKILPSNDIAAMKIVAISQRGKKRDFVDLYWYCTRHEKLYEVVVRALNQYPGQKRNVPHILKSLTYFNDADNEPMPRLFFKATWKEIRLFFQKEIKKIAKSLFHL